MTAKSSLPVVVLSTADFDSPVLTNKQHLAIGLAATRPVAYIESLGLRKPTFGRTDLGRMARKAAQAVHRGADRQIAETNRSGVTLIKPLAIPFHGLAPVRLINRGIIAAIERKIPFEEYILWSFSPLTYGLERSAAATVYHSVDLLHAQPRMPSRTLERAERHLVLNAAAIIASSTGVEEHLRSIGARDVTLWENVAQSELFATQVVDREPRAIFAGNLSTTKVDFEILEKVAGIGIPLALAGPIAIDGTNDQPRVQRLMERDNVQYLGNLEANILAREVARSTVGLIPYQLNAYTAGVFPLKVFEYMAAGLSVVSTNLPSLKSTDQVQFADPASFPRRVEEQINQFNEVDALARRRIAMERSWTRRIQAANELLANLSENSNVRKPRKNVDAR